MESTFAMSRSHVKLFAVAGLAASFTTADVAFAGKTGGDRLRPGSGFHNRNNVAARPAARPAYNYNRTRSNWATPAPTRPLFSETQNPAYAPRVVQTPAYAPQPRVAYSQPARVTTPQPARVTTPQPRVAYSQPRVIYSQPRVVYAQPAPAVSTPAPVVTPRPATPAPRTASGSVVTPR